MSSPDLKAVSGGNHAFVSHLQPRQLGGRRMSLAGSPGRRSSEGAQASDQKAKNPFEGLNLTRLGLSNNVLTLTALVHDVQEGLPAEVGEFFIVNEFASTLIQAAEQVNNMHHENPSHNPDFAPLLGGPAGLLDDMVAARGGRFFSEVRIDLLPQLCRALGLIGAEHNWHHLIQPIHIALGQVPPCPLRDSLTNALGKCLQVATEDLVNSAEQAPSNKYEHAYALETLVIGVARTKGSEGMPALAQDVHDVQCTAVMHVLEANVDKLATLFGETHVIQTKTSPAEILRLAKLVDALNAIGAHKAEGVLREVLRRVPPEGIYGFKDVHGKLTRQVPRVLTEIDDPHALMALPGALHAVGAETALQHLVEAMDVSIDFAETGVRIDGETAKRTTHSQAVKALAVCKGLQQWGHPHANDEVEHRLNVVLNGCERHINKLREGDKTVPALKRPDLTPMEPLTRVERPQPPAPGPTADITRAATHFISDPIHRLGDRIQDGQRAGARGLAGNLVHGAGNVLGALPQVVVGVGTTAASMPGRVAAYAAARSGNVAAAGVLPQLKAGNKADADLAARALPLAHLVWNADNHEHALPEGYSAVGMGAIPRSLLAREDGGSGAAAKLKFSDGWRKADRVNGTPEERRWSVLTGNAWSGLKVGVYYHAQTQRMILSFVGVTGSTLGLLKSHIGQAVGISSTAFQEAAAVVKAFADHYGRDSIEVAGHSHGGALAQYAATAAGVRGIGFNSAGLHPQLHYMLGDRAETADFVHFNAPGDWLTSMEGPLPYRQIGERYLLPDTREPALVHNPFPAHLINRVVTGLEQVVPPPKGLVEPAPPPN